jgi:hypothetical protein
MRGYGMSECLLQCWVCGPCEIPHLPRDFIGTNCLIRTSARLIYRLANSCNRAGFAGVIAAVVSDAFKLCSEVHSAHTTEPAADRKLSRLGYSCQ